MVLRSWGVWRGFYELIYFIFWKDIWFWNGDLLEGLRVSSNGREYDRENGKIRY